MREVAHDAGMTSQQRGLRVASALFALFAIAHIFRLVTKTEVVVGGNPIGMWVSIVALLVAASLSLWFWRLSK
jgi:hypothetical protein